MRRTTGAATGLALCGIAFCAPLSAEVSYTLTRNQYSLIGVPATLSPPDDTPNALFGDEIAAVDPAATYRLDWILYKYGPFGEAGAPGYAEVGEDESLNTSLGYWIVQTVADSLAVELPISAGELPPPGVNQNDALFWDDASGSYIARQPPGVSANASSMQPFLGVNYIIALFGIFPSRNALEPFIGEIAMFAGNFAPRGWALCDGQVLAINQNQALFSLLGTTYGGDGRTTFALPDLRGRAAVHSGNGSAGPGLDAVSLGLRAGSDTHRHVIPLPPPPTR